MQTRSRVNQVYIIINCYKQNKETTKTQQFSICSLSPPNTTPISKPGVKISTPYSLVTCRTIFIRNSIKEMISGGVYQPLTSFWRLSAPLLFTTWLQFIDIWRNLIILSYLKVVMTLTYTLNLFKPFRSLSCYRTEFSPSLSSWTDGLTFVQRTLYYTVELIISPGLHASQLVWDVSICFLPPRSMKIASTFVSTSHCKVMNIRSFGDGLMTLPNLRSRNLTMISHFLLGCSTLNIFIRKLCYVK